MPGRMPTAAITKRIKIKTAYNLAIVKNLITKMSRKIIVTGDGKPFDGKMLLATFANGAFTEAVINALPMPWSMTV